MALHGWGFRFVSKLQYLAHWTQFFVSESTQTGIVTVVGNVCWPLVHKLQLSWHAFENGMPLRKMCVLLQPIEAKNLHVASLPGIFWQIEGIDVNVVVVGVLVGVEVELDGEATVVVEFLNKNIYLVIQKRYFKKSESGYKIIIRHRK